MLPCWADLALYPCIELTHSSVPLLQGPSLHRQMARTTEGWVMSWVPLGPRNALLLSPQALADERPHLWEPLVWPDVPSERLGLSEQHRNSNQQWGLLKHLSVFKWKQHREWLNCGSLCYSLLPIAGFAQPAWELQSKMAFYDFIHSPFAVQSDMRGVWFV